MRKIITIIAIITLVSCTKEEWAPMNVQTNSTTPNTSNTTSTCSGKRTTSVQCIGTTQSGGRCKNMTLSCNSKCYLHGGN
jgi:hypothetical protein